MEMVTILWIVYFIACTALWSFIDVKNILDFLVVVVLLVAVVSSFAQIRVETTKRQFAEQGMYLQEDKK